METVPRLEQKAHLLADANERKEYLYKAHLNGLQKILELVKNKHSNSEILIVGGGPSGLIQGLLLTFTGHKFRIIEKRQADSERRANVITLGKDTPLDLSILFFFGVISSLEKDQKASFGHMKKQLVEVAIGDLESTLKLIYKALNRESQIEYNKQLTLFEREEDQAKVTIENQDNQLQETLSPSMIIVTDGANSEAKKKLGISTATLAKTTQIVYSTLEKAPLQNDKNLIRYKISNFLNGLCLAISMIVYACVHRVNLEEAFGKTIEGGPSAVFRIPAHDYLIRCLREKEQNFINQQRNELDILNDKIQKLKLKKDLSDSKQAQLKKLKDKRNLVQNNLDLYLTNQAHKIHGLMDILSSLYSKRHRIQKMKVKKNYVVDINVGKAERSFVKVGKTPIFLRGDASHITDPYSGYGCKTALEETLADQFIFQRNDPKKMNSLEMACQKFGHEYFQYRMINQGLRERSLYRSNTELLSRYLDLAIKTACFSSNDASMFEKISSKTEIYGHNPLISFTEEEKAFAQMIQDRLIHQFTTQTKIQRNSIDNLDEKWVHKLSSKEKKLIKNFIKNKMYHYSSIDKKLESQLKSIAAKMTYEGLEEGFLIALILQNINNKCRL